MNRPMNPAPDTHSVVFVVGARRSGTTLLQAMLRGHPDLIVHPKEAQFIFELYQRHGDRVEEVSAALETLGSHPYRAPDVTHARLAAVAPARGPVPLRTLLDRYVDLWAGEALNARMPVFKHPYLIFHLDAVFHLYPRARVIHVVRDPRANVASQRARWPEASLAEATRWWRRAVHAGRARKRQRPDSIVEVRYEDLVQKPEHTLHTLFENLPVDYHPAVQNFTLQTRTFDRDADPRRVRYTRPDPERLRVWRRRLTSVEVRLVERWCAEEMLWWGYRPSHPPASTPGILLRLAGESVVLAAKQTLRRAFRASSRQP